MKKYYIIIEVWLGGYDDAIAYYTRLVNESALEEMKKTKVVFVTDDYCSEGEPFEAVADITEVTDEKIEILKKCGLDHISAGNLMLVDENGKESNIPFKSSCEDALLDYIPK